MKLSLLIPTIEKRGELLRNLLAALGKQLIGVSKNVENIVEFNYYRYIFKEFDVEILVHLGDNLSIGKKRNNLLNLAKSDYVCFVDDDDMVSDDYIETLLEAIKTNPDCVSLRGIMTTNGVNPEVFEHSLRYKSWKTTKKTIKYERYPNHLNCIRADIAKQFKFPEINHGEDFDWSKRLHESGLLKTEFYTDKILYYYKFVTNK